LTAFQVSARTLVHLGAELITSDSIAFYELIKNSIDAGSPKVDIEFFIHFNQAKIIEVKEKWEKVSNSELVDIPDWREDFASDLDQIRESKVDIGCNTQRCDVLLDKALSAESPVHACAYLDKLNYIKISDSGEGMDESTLENAFLTIGTDYKIVSEKQGQPYLGNKGIGRLSMMRLASKAKVTSWTTYSSPKSIEFDWREFDIKGKLISDIDVEITDCKSEPITESGTEIILYGIKHTWTEKDIKSKLISTFLRKLRNPFETKNRYRFPINIYFNDPKRVNRFAIKRMDPELWSRAQKTLRLEFDPDKENACSVKIWTGDNESDSIPYLTDIPRLSHKFECSEVDLEKIGKFVFNLKWFNRTILRSQLKSAGLSSNARALTKELDIWSGGVAIYRDGFRIGFSGDVDDKDWFNIDAKALRGQGFTVNRLQTVGALEISSKENNFLQDRSNREGLIDNTQMELVSRIITEVALLELRNVINKEKKEEAAKELENVLEKGVDSANDRLENVRKSVSDLKLSASSEQRITLNRIDEELHFVANKIKSFEEVTSHLQEQREDILELAGTGTMMHVIMHELARTTSQTRGLLKQVAKHSGSEAGKLIGKLESEIKTINTRLRQFDPLSSTGRQRSTKFDLVELITTILDGYSAKFERHKIQPTLLVDENESAKPFFVNMVKGFITIAIENLISNSVYWLKQQETFSEYAFSEKREIVIEVDTVSQCITTWDSGPGIPPGDRERIFDPGYTTKPSLRDGKGFGLFIAKEVTEYRGGKLFLDSYADKDGRLRRFVVELPRGQ